MSTKKVLVDTCFLISLVNEKAPHHKTAVEYYKYFIANDIEMYLSTVVVSEFHQRQSILALMRTKNYIILPYNYHDAMATADICFLLGMTDRVSGQSKAEFKDDLKLIGQAKANDIDYMITEDEKTLAKYVERIKEANLIETELILLKDGFDVTIFNGGQTALKVAT